MNRWASLLILVATLAGCELEMKWEDTTGQARNNDQAHADSLQCVEESGYAKTGYSSADEYADFEKTTLACMAARGWQPVKTS